MFYVCGLFGMYGYILLEQSNKDIEGLQLKVSVQDDTMMGPVLIQILMRKYPKLDFIDEVSMADVAFLSSIKVSKIPELSDTCVVVMISTDPEYNLRDLDIETVDHILKKDYGSSLAEKLFANLFEGETPVTKRKIKRTKWFIQGLLKELF